MHPGALAKTRPDHPAIILGERRVSYAALAQRATHIARYLRLQGLGRGDVIALKMGNDPDFLAICWAAQQSGLY